MHGKSPEVRGDGVRPVVLGKDEHGSGGDSEVSDSFFSNATLMMCVDAAKADGLVSSFASGFECSVGEDSVVTVIVVDADIVAVGVGFKGKFAREDGISVICLV